MSYSWDSAPPDDDEGGRWFKNERGNWERVTPFNNPYLDDKYSKPIESEPLGKLEKILIIGGCAIVVGSGLYGIGVIVYEIGKLFMK